MIEIVNYSHRSALSIFASVKSTVLKDILNVVDSIHAKTITIFQFKMCFLPLKLKMVYLITLNREIL